MRLRLAPSSSSTPRAGHPRVALAGETVSEGTEEGRAPDAPDRAGQHRISGQIHDGWVGREVEVLVEERARKDSSQLFGKSEEFKTVVFEDDGTPAGSLRRVRVAGATPVTLIGVTRPAESPALVQIR